MGGVGTSILRERPTRLISARTPWQEPHDPQHLELDPAQPERYTFSLLRVFGSNTPQAQIDAAEKHYKDALMTRRFGLNRN